MTISTGTRLGAYEVVAPLGAGGMGEVWKARDTRLERSVAIKVLPAEFAANAQLRLRFEREAKSISQLNHPHICTLYDVGNDNGLEYLVLEFIEGETLTDRIARGPLPLRDVLRFGAQIAQALAKAHEAGIVHRDLKPANVMITPAGAKLLDFGLATEAAASSSSIVPATDLTVQKPLTQEGTVLGTFQYMAPEQLAGEEADVRTDIFALGAVLYEMLTGVRAFQGKSKTSLIAAIAGSEPQPPSRLQPLTPPTLEHVIARCLEKEPGERWQNAADVAEQLRWISETRSQPEHDRPVARRRRTLLPWFVNALLIAVSAALTWTIAEFRREPPRVITAAILPPEDATFGIDGNRGPMALSPDGKRIVFVASSQGKDMLWVRPLATETAQPLAGTEGARYPFWSPDGRYLGFFAGNKLQKIDSAGGPPQPLCETAAQVRGGTWSQDGIIVFTPGIRDGLSRISAAGGTPTPVTKLATGEGEFSHRFPQMLPDGQHFLYVAQDMNGAFSQAKAYVGSLDGTTRKLLVTSTGEVAYARGYLLFLRQRTLMAQRFDPKRLVLSGEARPIAEGVQFINTSLLGVFAVAADGTLAYRRTEAGSLSQMTILGRDGKETKVGTPMDLASPRLSNRGDRIIYSVVESSSGTADYWLYDVARGVPSRFTFDGIEKGAAVWSPDDRFIAYTAMQAMSRKIVVKASDGMSVPEVVFESPQMKIITDWSRDGRYIVFQAIDLRSRSSWDLWTYDTVRRTATPYLATPFAETGAVLSPDGKWMAYVSDEAGIAQVYVQTFPAGGGKWQVSTDGGAYPQWTLDGKELLFRGADQKVYAVDIQPQPAMRVGTPVPLMTIRTKTQTNFGREWSASNDGQRFIVNEPLHAQGPSPITIVSNWPAILK